MPTTARRPEYTLGTPVTYLKGVGTVRAEAFRRLGITSVEDLLYHVPHRYEDATTISRISSLEAGMSGTILGQVISKGVIPTRGGLRIFQAVLKDDSSMIELSWPGQPYLDRSVDKGDWLLASGPVRFYHGRQLQPREWINLGKEWRDEQQGAGRVLTVYPATEGLSFKVIRAVIETHLDALLPLVKEYLPARVLEEAGVPPLGQALRMIHRPATIAEAMHGRSRLAFEELLFVALLHRRAKAIARTGRNGIKFVNRRILTSKLKNMLKFELTAAQSRVLREIVVDMCSEHRMHRMLQGDVGSGKTIVAVFAALLAMENGYQVALMAPTELLAEQHMRSIGALLEPLEIAPMLLTGATPPRERKRIMAALATGQPALVIGTHALLQERTSFGKLGLGIIDEQHRFGVDQRMALGGKGEAPDILLLSATPIPRSLALTIHGDLDISVLDERPPGRHPISTYLRAGSARTRVFTFIERELAKGRQTYVVYPVIEESEKLDVKAATTMYEMLSAGPFANRRVALVHGRVPAAERDDIMRRFRDGEIDVLVATTVIEVGIDVPNATVMLIEHAERFGLAQLHQLRGRVGRGAEQSYCILVSDAGPDSTQRLRILADTEDGFEIARADLMMRGMGDLFGERQSGAPMFRVADPFRDEQLNEKARQVADRMLDADPELTSKANLSIRRVLSERYSRAMQLFRVG